MLRNSLFFQELFINLVQNGDVNKIEDYFWHTATINLNGKEMRPSPISKNVLHG